MDEKFEWNTEILLLELNDFIVFLKRNTQPSLFKDIETVSVQTIFYGLIATVSQPDYLFTLEVLKSLGEKENVGNDQTVVIEDVQAKKKAVSPAKSTGSTNQVVIPDDYSDFDDMPKTPSIEVKVSINSVKVFLFEDASSLKKINDKRWVFPRRKAFCRFLMKSLQLELKSFGDDRGLEKLEMAFSLDDLILDDTRHLKTDNKLFRLINKNTKNEEKQIVKFGLNQQKKTDVSSQQLMITERDGKASWLSW